MEILLAHDSFFLTSGQYLLPLESDHLKSLLVQGDVTNKEYKGTEKEERTGYHAHKL